MTAVLPARVAAAMAAAALLLTGLAGTALGHASLIASDPAEGSGNSISQLTQITLTFDDDLDPAKSQFSVVDASGATVATGHVTTDRKVMQATGLQLQWGAHEARWTAVATDGDLTRGVVHFTVIQDGGVSLPPGQTSAPANPATSQAPTPTPLGTIPTAAATSGDSTAIVIAVVGGLAVIAAGAWLLLGRRGRRS